MAERLKDIRAFIDSLYGRDLHAKRVDSLAAATLGVMTVASLAVAMIGQALAQARGLVTKHAIKQVDRLLSNGGIDVWESFARWSPHLVELRNDIVVAMDWTDFDGDGQATLALNLVTEPGRAMPLLWLSVWKDELKDHRNDIEDACLRRLSEVLPPACWVTILADRGFGDHKLFAYLADLGFGLCYSLRGNIHVTDASGETRTRWNSANTWRIVACACSSGSSATSPDGRRTYPIGTGLPSSPRRAHLNAPIRPPDGRSEQITITDPCHPLYRRCFSLVSGAGANGQVLVVYRDGVLLRIAARATSPHVCR
jgi:hypothetical protein